VLDLAVLGLELDSMMLKIFSNLNDSIILSPSLTDFFPALDFKIELKRISFAHNRNYNAFPPDIRAASTTAKKTFRVFPQALCIMDKICTR